MRRGGGIRLGISLFRGRGEVDSRGGEKRLGISLFGLVGRYASAVLRDRELCRPVVVLFVKTLRILEFRDEKRFDRRL